MELAFHIMKLVNVVLTRGRLPGQDALAGKTRSRTNFVPEHEVCRPTDRPNKIEQPDMNQAEATLGFDDSPGAPLRGEKPIPIDTALAAALTCLASAGI